MSNSCLACSSAIACLELSSFCMEGLESFRDIERVGDLVGVVGGVDFLLEENIRENFLEITFIPGKLKKLTLNEKKYIKNV